MPAMACGCPLARHAPSAYAITRRRLRCGTMARDLFANSPSSCCGGVAELLLLLLLAPLRVANETVVVVSFDIIELLAVGRREAQ